MYLINKMASSSPENDQVGSEIRNNLLAIASVTRTARHRVITPHEGCGQRKPCQGKSSFNLQTISPYPDSGSLFEMYIIYANGSDTWSAQQTPVDPEGCEIVSTSQRGKLAPEATQKPRPPQIPTAWQVGSLPKQG